MALLAASAAVSTRGIAQCAEGGHRPVEDLFRSDVVFPQEQGEVQLEIIPSMTHSAAASTSSLGGAWEYGLTNSWQIEGAWEGATHRHLNGGSTIRSWGNVSIGTKRSFMCLGGSPYDVSIGLDLESGWGSNAKPAVIVGRDFGDDAAQLFVGTVADVPLARASSQSDVTLTLGAFARLARFQTGTLLGSVEASLTSGAEQPNAFQLAPGLLWHSPDAWELGVGYAAVTTRPVGHELLAHVVFEFGGDK